MSEAAQPDSNGIRIPDASNCSWHWTDRTVEAGGGGHWGSWVLVCREATQKALSALLLPQALPWLPGACVSTIRVTLEGAGLYTQEPLPWQIYHEEGGLYLN